eukprot:GFUD01041777.1.p1 GENE.GFUD01041777.1~~GFUD01041777.1.p1  ORF type:complete len:270 (+),score=77.77 GFUD01041777.1:117-926(+)
MFLLLLIQVSSVMCTKHHYVYWNTTNPLFSDKNIPNLISVNEGNLPQEYDQLHLICPQDSKEHHVIYSVSKHEFITCRVTNPRPEKVMICDRSNPGQFRTITFRPFSPSPGGLEFKPGQNYYFISTSTPRDIHRRVGGACSTHNMKLTFMVSGDGRRTRLHNPVNHNRNLIPKFPQYHPNIESSNPEAPPGRVFHQPLSTPTVRSSDYIYYYSPRDLLQLKLAAKKHQLTNLTENKTRAEKLSSSSSSLTLSTALVLLCAATTLLKSCC